MKKVNKSRNKILGGLQKNCRFVLTTKLKITHTQ